MMSKRSSMKSTQVSLILPDYSTTTPLKSLRITLQESTQRRQRRREIRVSRNLSQEPQRRHLFQSSTRNQSNPSLRLLQANKSSQISNNLSHKLNKFHHKLNKLLLFHSRKDNQLSHSLQKAKSLSRSHKCQSN